MKVLTGDGLHPWEGSMGLQWRPQHQSGGSLYSALYFLSGNWELLSPLDNAFLLLWALGYHTILVFLHPLCFLLIVCLLNSTEFEYAKWFLSETYRYIVPEYFMKLWHMPLAYMHFFNLASLGTSSVKHKNLKTESALIDKNIHCLPNISWIWQKLQISMSTAV